MGAYFDAVVMLDDGPYPVWANGFSSEYGGHDLAGSVDWTDIRTRAVYAYLLEKPRRVWWVADECKLGEQLTSVWTDRFGVLPSRRVVLRDNIPESIVDFPILVNHDKSEYLDTASFEYCPLPLLCASFGADTLSGHPLATRWHGDTISVSRREGAKLAGLKQITEADPPPPCPPVDAGLLEEHPGLAAAFGAISQDRWWDFVQTFDESLNPILTVVRGLEPEPFGREHPVIDGVAYLAYIRHWRSHAGENSLQWGTTGQAKYTRPIPSVLAGPAATATTRRATSVHYPWGTTDGIVRSSDIGAARIDGAWAHIWEELPR